MDISHLLWLQGIREAAAPWVEQLFALISAAVVSPALLLIPCLVYWCVDKASGMFALASFTGANLATQTVKGIVCCLRPWVRSPLVHPSALAVTGATGYSFPSGHTTAATSVFGSLGWRFRRHRWLFAACVAVVVLVAFSRNFLGVHTPQDVIGAIVVSVLVMVAVSRVQAWVGAYPVGRRDSIALGSAVALGIAVLVFAFVRAFPVAYAADGTQLVNPVEMRVDTSAAGCASPPTAQRATGSSAPPSAWRSSPSSCSRCCRRSSSPSAPRPAGRRASTPTPS